MIFVASVAGQIGSQTDPPYSASKAANINFAQCLAKDLAPHGIRVNTVCPGMVQTPLNRSVWQAWQDQQPPDQRKSYDDWASEKIRQVVPLGRWQEPADIANMIVFLAPDLTRLAELQKAVRQYLAWKDIVGRGKELNLDTEPLCMALFG